MNKTSMTLNAGLIFMIAATLLTACKKEEVKYCEDNAAENKGMQLPCQYVGQGVLWFDKSTGDQLSTALSLDLWIDGRVLDVTSPSSNLTSPPPCDGAFVAGKMFFKKDLRGEATHTYKYEVKDESSVLWSGNITLTAKGCTQVELTR